MQGLYYKRHNCRLCHSTDIRTAISLAPMPIATPNFSIPDTDTGSGAFREPVPLDLSLCRSCGLLQVLHVGNPELQYANYVYTTSLSLGLAQHFERYTVEVLAAIRAKPGALVIEIGSNDGTLLQYFKKAGMRVLGIDPAQAIARQATAAGVETIAAFFTADMAKKVRAERGAADLMIANNVIANIDDMNDMIAGVHHLLADQGVFVFETQYGADVVERNLLDTVYHEHLSYFNIKPLSIGFARHGLELFDVQRVTTKGGSIRVFVQHCGGQHAVLPVVREMIDAEEKAGHYGEALYRNWMSEIAEIRQQLGVMAAAEHARGRKVGGYGVSVGTTTLLPQFAMTDKVDMLFDDDSKKAAKLIGPDYAIPVQGTDAVYQHNPGMIVIFAWRYADPIIAKHAKYLEQGGKFVIPLPKVRIVGKT